jgi:uncharacterized protein
MIKIYLQHIISYIFLIIIFLANVLQVSAYYNPGTPTGFVNDFSSSPISNELDTSLETKLTNFQKETSNEIAIVIIDSMKGDYIENFAVKLFEDYKIGTEKNDNGILILITKEEREIRIEVGYGLEGAVTDSHAKYIINTDIVPALRADDYALALNSSTDNLISMTKGEYTGDISSVSSSTVGMFVAIIFWIFATFSMFAGVMAQSKSIWLGGILGMILGIIISVIIWNIFAVIPVLLFSTIFGLIVDFILSAIGIGPFIMNSGSGFGGGFPGGGRSGGFGGFSGGSSGGGGASGSW